MRQFSLVVAIALVGFAGPADAASSCSQTHTVKASSFADPADIRAFKKCKKGGHSDKYCFGVGDNGIGYWGDDTAGDKPMCALPSGEWTKFGNKARGRKIDVTYHGKSVTCELRDTLPAHPKNGAGIDLNPGTLKALGLKPGDLYSPVQWKWADPC
jgi:hypothetical protein